MANLKATQMLLLEDVFQMGSGFVLNFSDRTYSAFFAEELSINIDDPKYAVAGGSKGKRLRYFLQNETRPTVVKTIKALWEYREAIRERAGEKEAITNAPQKVAELVRSLGGQWDGGTTPPPPATITADPSVIADLTKRLTDLTALAPHTRGYAFEKFLKDLFNAYQMEARDAFRIVGEQIDGSFQLDGATYLLEAKWQNAKSDAAELRAFHGKIEEKAAWSRGLFVSYTGFSDDGLAAFGRGKKLICMDGRDIYEALSRAIPLTKVLQDKTRAAATSGALFVRVSDLYP